MKFYIVDYLPFEERKNMKNQDYIVMICVVMMMVVKLLTLKKGLL